MLFTKLFSTIPEKHVEQLRRGGRGGGGGCPRKSVAQSARQYDVTSRVGDFQNGEQSVHRRDR